MKALPGLIRIFIIMITLIVLKQQVKMSWMKMGMKIKISDYCDLSLEKDKFGNN